MTAVEKHRPGTPCWFDLMTSSPDGARRFYGELFGWSFEIGPPESGGYTNCKLGTHTVAGLGPLPPDAPFPAAWSVYFGVESVDASCEAIQREGGQCVMGPMDVFEQGRLAFCIDPAGAAFGLWQPKAHPGATLVAEPGAMTWCETNSRDAKKAVAFYEKVFGLAGKALNAGDASYVTLQQGDQAAAGVLQLPAQVPLPSHWVVYFAVENTDDAAARAARLGGKLKMGPFDTPYGRVAFLTDPEGVVFGIIKASA